MPSSKPFSFKDIEQVGGKSLKLRCRGKFYIAFITAYTGKVFRSDRFKDKNSAIYDAIVNTHLGLPQWDIFNRQ